MFLPDYNVSLAERLIPASDVSEQISTAGYEASGTGNMKFMMNGALTVGTRDGATIEMARDAGEDNFFLFGLTAEQVEDSRAWYDPRWHYEHEAETREALDLIFSGHFNPDEPGIFAPIRDALLERGDYYMHLADLTSYAEAQSRLAALYARSRCLDAEGHRSTSPRRDGSPAIARSRSTPRRSGTRSPAPFPETPVETLPDLKAGTSGCGSRRDAPGRSSDRSAPPARPSPSSPCPASSSTPSGSLQSGQSSRNGLLSHDPHHRPAYGARDLDVTCAVHRIGLPREHSLEGLKSA